MQSLLSDTRKVQLLIQLFNRINCWFVQGVKVACVLVSVLQGYLGIRLRQKHVIIASYCAFTHIVCFVGYCGVYGRAYRVKELQKKLKGELKVACARLPPTPEYMAKKESFKAAVDALSCPGLKVGGFHEMERQSALIFLDFVESQVISLLIAF